MNGRSATGALTRRSSARIRNNPEAAAASDALIESLWFSKVPVWAAAVLNRFFASLL